MNQVTNAAFNIWWEQLTKLFVSKGLYLQHEVEQLDKMYYYSYFEWGDSVEKVYYHELELWNT